jgi:uncharacterized protein with beta-barrel porin domain
MTGTPDALTQLSGEVHGSVQAVIVDDSRYVRQAVLGRLRQAPYAGGSGAIAALGSGGPTLAYGESAALSFQSTGSGFNILGIPIARDAALVEAGGDLQLTAQAKIGVSYAGQLANSAHDHSVKGNFTWRF